MISHKFVFLILLQLGLNSCVTPRKYQVTTHASFAPLSSMDCEVPPAQIHLFFEGEPTNFTYKKLGIIEIIGKRNANLKDMLDHLRYEAWSHCANGVIHIKKEYRAMEGDVDIDYETVDIRNETIYSGIAVNIEMTPEFYEKYGEEMNTEFIDKTEIRISNNAERKILHPVATLLIVTFGILLLGGLLSGI